MTKTFPSSKFTTMLAYFCDFSLIFLFAILAESREDPRVKGNPAYR